MQRIHRVPFKKKVDSKKPGALYILYSSFTIASCKLIFPVVAIKKLNELYKAM